MDRRNSKATRAPKAAEHRRTPRRWPVASFRVESRQVVLPQQAGYLGALTS